MKKMIGIVGNNAEYDEKLADYFVECQAVVKRISINSPLYNTLQEIFKKDFRVDQEIGPVQLTADHIRLFYFKLNKGIHSVSHFLGKEFTKTADLFRYYKDKVGEKPYGKNWVLDVLQEDFDFYPAGVYLITDLTFEEADELKARFGKDFVSMRAVEEGGEEPAVDVPLHIKTTKKSTEQEANQALKQVKQLFSKESASARTTTA